MTKILVLSDVHGDYDVFHKIMEAHKDADYKIYLGDFQMPKEDQIEYSKLFDYVVTGNCDYEGISENTILAEIEGKKILITHGHHFDNFMSKIDFSKLFYTAKEKECELILHGHDHLSVLEEVDEITRFNPGSTTRPFNTKIGTYGLINIKKNGDWKLEHINVNTL